MFIFSEPTEEELKIMRDNAHCSEGCIAWNRFCNSQCCRGFSVKNSGQDLNLQKIKVFGNSSPDLIRYYQLHNCTYRMPHLYIPTRNASVQGDRIWIMERCKALLPDGRCKYHDNGKPKVCRELNMENIKKGVYYGGGKITPRCQYRFLIENEGAKP